MGRLDIDSSGLILLTNDGELANRLTHPRYEIAKTYRVKVGGGAVEERALRALREGSSSRTARRAAPACAGSEPVSSS